MPVAIQPSVQSFFDYLKYEKRYSVHTLTSYQTDISAFLDFLEIHYGKMSLQEINYNFVRSWLAGLKDEGLSSRSLKRKISSLKSFFKYQLRTSTIQSTPMSRVISPKVSKRLPVFIAEADAKNMIDALNLSTEDWKSLNAKMLVVIFYATGMRLSELITLKEKQIDFSRSQIKVLGKGNKERILPISPELIHTIRDYQLAKKKEFQKTDDFLLVTERGKKLYPKYAYLLVSGILGQSATLDKKSPHVLRHTFATHLMNNGADLNAVKELLGHSSLAATQVYTHNSIGKLKDIHKKAHPKA